MSKICQLTKRKRARGKSYTIRGIAKKKKGIGLNITGSTLRSFKANVFKKRFWFGEEKRWITLTLSAAAIRTIEKKGLSAVVREMRAEGQKI